MAISHDILAFSTNLECCAIQELRINISRVFHIVEQPGI